MLPSNLALLQRCQAANQSHLLAYWNDLTVTEQQDLAFQIQSLDFGLLTRLFQGESHSVDWSALAERAEPPNAIQLGQTNSPWSEDEAIRAGRAAIAAGKVAMILVAGGQGTRLGFDQPKGMFPIGPVSRRTLFQMHVDSLRGAMRRYQVSIPMLVMTSPATDAETRQYFAAHHNLGLAEDQLMIFQQGTMPAIDSRSGQVLLESKGRIALSPNGHGGIVAALADSGCLAMARERGIEHLFYAQVDNPLVTACDPLLIGYHLLSGSQMTTQVVRKRFAKEKVGNVVSIDGSTQIIEYSDLPDSVAEQRNADGSLRLWAGNIAVHVLDVDFLRWAATQSESLPFHHAKKVVPFVGADGQIVKPTDLNAIKFERFVFDLLPHAERTIVVEGEAAQVFAPVKNADGSPTDTPTDTRQALVRLHQGWLESAGVRIDRDSKVEINPLWALDADEVRAQIRGDARIAADTYFT